MLRELRHAKLPLAVVFAAILWLAAPGSAGAQDGFTREFELPGDALVLVNLIGEVRVEGHSGSSYSVEIDVQGEDASEDAVEIETNEGRSGTEVLIHFPEDRRYVYPRMGRGSNTSFRMDNDGRDSNWLSRVLGSGRKIDVRGSGSGTEIWADVTIRVPNGGDIDIYLGVGQIEANGVDGNVNLDTQSGPVVAAQIQGELRIDTGSGHVEVRGVQGPVDVDTGSGHVEVEEVVGDVLVDTGSGHVELYAIESRTIEVDTGSGGVDVRQASCEDFEVDTGSGGVRARELVASSASIDTGSGGIEMELIEMGTGDYDMDTGSGGISLRLPANASAEIYAETSGGSVRVDVEDADIRALERDYARLTVGGGDARINLETGSGTIRITN